MHDDIEEAGLTERVRLRLLLKRCERKLIAAALTLEASGIFAIRFDELLADLRRELAKEPSDG